MDTYWQQEILEMRDEAARLTRIRPLLHAGLDAWREEDGSQA